MASTNPAAFLGLDGELGRLAPGYRADLVAMDESLRRPDPRERIKEPADRYHRWRFRLQLPTEALVEATAFNDRLGRMVSDSGRSPS